MKSGATVKLKKDNSVEVEGETYGQKQAKKITEIIGTASTLMAGSKVFDDKLALELVNKLVAIVDTSIRDERSRILALLLKEQLPMVAKYKVLIKHTGGMLETSMGYAYSKGLNDVFKLIAKGAEDEKQAIKKT